MEPEGQCEDQCCTKDNKKLAKIFSSRKPRKVHWCRENGLESQGPTGGQCQSPVRPWQWEDSSGGNERGRGDTVPGETGMASELLVTTPCCSLAGGRPTVWCQGNMAAQARPQNSAGRTTIALLLPVCTDFHLLKLTNLNGEGLCASPVPSRPPPMVDLRERA
jgi:hypothetical protein